MVGLAFGAGVDEGMDVVLSSRELAPLGFGRREREVAGCFLCEALFLIGFNIWVAQLRRIPYMATGVVEMQS